ncbi:Glutathione reductase [Apophysomyces ossiformis]|uniref:Glutathione reductase n=1 Tax=Apophysomyces ossiformis TaxID=679940 RepID=A0A8H7BYX6_9FUNG|nr:Glutathione reductase [Apophysomyces ossiformis]
MTETSRRRIEHIYTSLRTNMAPTEYVYDLLVIGAGSGGLAVARRASSKYKAKVAIVEGQHRLGGTCVNVGCVPKKIMWNAASMAESLHHAAGYGFQHQTKPFDWTFFKGKRDAYIRRLNGIYEANLAKDNVKHLQGLASFVDQNTVQIVSGSASYTVQAKKIVIATGSHPIIPDTPGAELGIDSDGFFDLEHQPKRVAVVGTGYVGIELAGIFNTLGTKTTIFSRTCQILRSFDAIIKNNLLDEMRKSGIEFICTSNIVRLARSEGGIRVDYTVAEPGGETHSVEVDRVLWAIGRAPSVESLDLDVVGIKQDEKGFIVVDDYQNTSCPNVYALGDVCGRFQLTPVAIAAGRHLADRLFGNKPEAHLEYENIPTVIFAHPTAGSLGLTEEQARQKYGDENIKVYSSNFVSLYFAMLDHKEPTAYKLIVQGPQEKVIGLHMLGRGSDEILQGFGVAVRMGATKVDFDNCVAIHPTAAEELRQSYDSSLYKR